MDGNDLIPIDTSDDSSGDKTPLTYSSDLAETPKKLGLVKLRDKHREIIALHLSGRSAAEIAKTVGKTASYVASVIADPLSKQVIGQVAALHEAEFKSLVVLANETLRESMQPYKRDSVRLKAASIFFNREKEMKEGATETAEDVMGKIMQIIQAENVQINFGVKS